MASALPPGCQSARKTIRLVKPTVSHSCRLQLEDQLPINCFVVANGVASKHGDRMVWFRHLRFRSKCLPVASHLVLTVIGMNGARTSHSMDSVGDEFGMH
eukprot:5003421-Amphidinium_carterae.1